MRIPPNVIRLLALMLFIGLLPSGYAQQPVTYTYSYTGAPLPIFRDDADVISVVQIFVPRALRVTKVVVNVDIDYPRPGDLDVFFFSPIGTRTKLIEGNCGGTGTLLNTTFDDSAQSRYSDFCPIEPGRTFLGNEALSNSVGEGSFGVWRLAVENNESDDNVGWVIGASVTITGTPVIDKPTTAAEGVLNAASLQSGFIAPGQMLAILGGLLGPVEPVAAPAGNLPTALGGVEVSFDGVPAGIAYASLFQLRVQAPYSLTPGGQTTMRITFDGDASDPVVLNVAGTMPGLYTINGVGAGQLSAVNQNGTLNSSQDRAAKGSVVVLYAVGLGAVDPALSTGQAAPASPLSTTTASVFAYIDGILAPVEFAGAAPGYPGVYQMNIRIPEGVSSGSRQVYVYANGTPAQSNVNLWVE
jgi:uncharacterized protein (TIGR03437 family)